MPLRKTRGMKRKYKIVAEDDNEEIGGTGANCNSFLSCLRYVVVVNFIQFKMWIKLTPRMRKKYIFWVKVVKNDKERS